uniref:ATP synthase subunit 8 n=1 Tax=Ernothrips longitudinalis TaxID=3045428 RepID=UPI0030E54703
MPQILPMMIPLILTILIVSIILTLNMNDLFWKSSFSKKSKKYSMKKKFFLSLFIS